MLQLTTLLRIFSGSVDGYPGILERNNFPLLGNRMSVYCTICTKHTFCTLMTTTNVTEARNNLPELINRVSYANERILLERHGKPVAAIVSLEDLKRLEALEDAIDSAALRRAVEENDGFVTLESIIANRDE